MKSTYLAGLIDGEGYFGLLPNKSKHLKVTSFSPVFKIGMTGSSAKVIMLALKANYGGGIEKRSTLSKGGREVIMFTVKSKKSVLNLINDVLPDLIVKKDQALLLIEFCNLPSSHSLYGSFSEDTLVRKLEIYSELKALKAPESLATTE